MAFPKLHVTGGPHAKNLKLTLDDVEMPGVSRAEIVLDVNDAARLRVWHFIEADLDIAIGSLETKFKLRVMSPIVDADQSTRAYQKVGEFEANTVEKVFEMAAEALVDFVPGVPARPTPIMEVVPDA